MRPVSASGAWWRRTKKVCGFALWGIALACSSDGEHRATSGAGGQADVGTGGTGTGGGNPAVGTGGTPGAAGGAGGTLPLGSGGGVAPGGMTGQGGALGAGGSVVGGPGGAFGTGGGGAGDGGAAPNGAGGAPVSDAGAGGAAGMLDPNAIWMATDGNDGNPGTEAMPLATLAAATGRVQAGGTIYVKPGTYATGQTVSLRTDGQDSQPIRLFAAPRGRPVFDFSQQPRGDSSARGLQISGSYWHLRGLDVINAGDNCIHVSGHHNTIEWVNTYGCSDTGLQITANGSEAGDPTRAAHNTVLNCDSHDNYDAQNQGENADGFAAKLYIGAGNVFRGCRAWNNADDGWDLFASDDVVVIEDCWAIANGKIGAGQDNTNGDGNGFKLGGAARLGDPNQGGAVHRVSDSFSIENRSCGFTRNNNTQLPVLTMCGGRGDGRGTLCNLVIDGTATVQMSAAEAIAAPRDANGNLPPVR